MFDLLVLTIVSTSGCDARDDVPVRVELLGFDQSSARTLRDELERGVKQIGAKWCQEAIDPRVRVWISRDSENVVLRVDNRDSRRVVERRVVYKSLPRDAPAFALSALVFEMMRGSWIPKPSSTKPPSDAIPDLSTGVRRAPVWTEPPPPEHWDSARPSPSNVRAGALFTRLSQDLALVGAHVSSDLPWLGSLSATVGLGYLSGQRIEGVNASATVSALSTELGLRYSPLYLGPWRLLSWLAVDGKRLRFRPEITNDDVSPTTVITVEIAAGAATQYRYHSFFIEPSVGLGTALRGVDVFDGDTQLLRAGRLTARGSLSIGFDIGR